MCTCPHPKESLPWQRQTDIPSSSMTFDTACFYLKLQWCTMMYVHLLAHDYMLWQDYAVLLSSHYATPQSIIPNMPLSPAVPLLLCWMLRTGLALSKCYLEPDSYSPFHAMMAFVALLWIPASCQEPCTNVRPVPTLHGVVIAKATSCAC